VLAKPVIDEHDVMIKRSEIRLRGNLDLRKESFVLGFERFADAAGRYVAQVSHRGDLEDLRADRKRSKQERRAAERAEELQARRSLAIQIATREGNVSQNKLARALGLDSERTVAGLLNEMVVEGVFVRAGRAGYALASAQVQIPGSFPQEVSR
jgi:biotin operon repressor